ncbi:hypothetical protein SGR_6210 [Streptomyces griseus subsp. griseus NBRC 13350]|uniref:Uncharacterized protein n=2 Tax=Streptomyces TaxID=1883 RepID=B1W4M2_STRGG|nr:hypothetical protein SGR_6210 [Streptomyces griseus subsp. griseus NBRC 13350]
MDRWHAHGGHQLGNSGRLRRHHGGGAGLAVGFGSYAATEFGSHSAEDFVNRQLPTRRPIMIVAVVLVLLGVLFVTIGIHASRAQGRMIAARQDARNALIGKSVTRVLFLGVGAVCLISAGAYVVGEISRG